MANYDENSSQAIHKVDFSSQENKYELCFICCSNIESSRVQKESIEQLNSNLTVVFVLRTLLKVPSIHLEVNLKEYGNPATWIKLCDQCTELTRQAEKLYSQIVKNSKELNSIQKLIINKIRTLSCTNSTKSNGNVIGRRICNFVKNYGYIEQDSTKISPFIEGDKLANYLITSSTYSNTSPSKFDNQLDDNEDISNLSHSPGWEDDSINQDMDDHDDRSQDFETDTNFNTITSIKPTRSTNRSSKKKLVSGLRRTYKKMIKINDKWKCRHCDTLLPSSRACYLHEMKMHHSNSSDPCICDICGKTLTNPDSLMVHRRSVHKIRLDGTQTIRNPRKPPPPRKKHPQTCNLCGKYFQDRMGLRNHIRYVHEKEMEYKCQICDETTAFARKSDFKRHQLTVHKDNPKIKELIEEGMGIWRCRVTGCRAQFFKKRNLDKHNEKYHKDSTNGRFACSFCGRGFWELYNLKNHELVHKNKEEGINPFCCEECGLGFRSPVYLHNHKRVHKRK